ncbi:MAG: nucleotidyltransferase domain-containing protein [bacterium]
MTQDRISAIIYPDGAKMDKQSKIPKKQFPISKVTLQKVKKVIEKIIETNNPSKVILFGSYITGKLNINSDLDVLVVSANRVESPRKESVRIRRALKGILMPMDIIVVNKSDLEELRDTPMLIYREALRNGKFVSIPSKQLRRH